MQPLAGLVRQRVFAHYFGLGPTRPTRSTRRSAFPTSCRTCSAKARCRRRSSRCTPALLCARRAARGRPRRRRGRRAAGAGRRGARRSSACSPRRCSSTSSRPGFTARSATLTIEHRPHPVSGRRAARAVGLVPGRPQQPPPVPAVLRRAGVMWNAAMIATLRDLRRPHARCPRLAVIWRGARSSAARCSSPCRCPSCCGWRPDLRLRARYRPPTHVRDGRRATLRPVVRQPRRRPDQRLHRHAAGQPAADGRGRGAVERAVRCTLLPVSLFGMSVSAAELPAMSGAASAGRRRARARAPAARCGPAADRVLRRAVGGGVSRARRRRRGRAAADRTLHRADAVYVWAILAGSAVGLLASDAGPAVFVDLLRAARHAHAAALCASSAWRLTTVLGYVCGVLVAAVRSASRRGGAPRASRRRPAWRAGWRC